MKELSKQMGRMAVAFPLVFAAIVVYLQVVQPNYDPVHQFMSELALGPSGWLMLVAFLALGASMAALGIGFFLTGARTVIVVLMVVVALGFVGAGFIRLDVNANVHIGFVALSFVMSALSMYLLPHCVETFHMKREMVVSWVFGVAFGMSVALGGMIPVGIGQRLTALLLILWSVWVGLRLSTVGKKKNA